MVCLRTAAARSAALFLARSNRCNEAAMSEQVSYGSATVSGTTWLVVDRCDSSTLFKVTEGTLSIRDFVKDRTLNLAAGNQYIAKVSIPRLDPDALP